MNCHNYPIIKILFPYLSGIILAVLCDFPLICLPVFLAVIAGLLLISSVLYTKPGYHRQWIPGLCITLCAISLGFLITNVHFAPHFSEKQSDFITKNKEWVVKITEPPRPGSKSVKTVVSLENTVNGRKIREKAVLYFKKDSGALQLTYGDILLIYTTPALVAAPKNPDAFDNRIFLRKRGICFQGYVSGGQWKKIDHDTPNPVKRYAYVLMRFFSGRFAQSGLSGDEYSMITAILLGNDDTMDPELKAHYASAGVSHILCVSGMHVGIIFMILDFILKPLEISRKTKILKAVILLFAIWFYANITGLSPSVTRAATMFTFVSFGSLMQRNTTVFHSLYASLFFLLILNPLLLFEVGFQLSYLAVFGIVIFQKPVVRLLKPKSRAGKYVWELTTVSLSAQLTTFPLAVFYFGQFPNYFLLANISILFLSFLVIVTGVVLLFLSFSVFLAEWVGTILTYEIRLMNTIIKTIDGFPGAVTENISLHPLQVILLYLFIIIIPYTIMKKNKRYVLLGLSVFALFSLIFPYTKYVNSNRKEITVYSIPKTSAINFNQKGNSILLVDSSFTKKEKSYHFNIKNHERKRKINSNLHYFNRCLLDREKRVFLSGNFIRFNDISLYILDRNQKLYPSGKKIKIDYLYIRNNPKPDLEKIVRIFDFSKMIIDESNSRYYEERWIGKCEKHQISYHSTRQKGFLSLLSD